MNLLKADKEDFQNSEWSSVIQPWVAHNRSERTFVLWSQDHYVQFHKRSNNCGNQESTEQKTQGVKTAPGTKSTHNQIQAR